MKLIEEFEKVEGVKRPLKKGETFLVPCIVREEGDISDWSIVQGEIISKSKRLFITPVINHPHHDKENGQPERHYHIDYRFLKHSNDGDFPTVINSHSKHFFGEKIRLQKGLDGELEYFAMPVINEDFTGITPVNLISKTKLKHKCIYRGTCPHRGYDLSQTKPVNGKITCPLHGLQFDATTGALLPHLALLLK